MIGELVVELVIKTMDMLKTTNHGIQLVHCSIARRFSLLFSALKYLISYLLINFSCPKKFTRNLRFTLPFPMLAYPFYLWNRSPGKTGSHFDPNSALFVPNEKKDVITSTICWTTMAALLIGLSFVVGPIEVMKLYGAPYWDFVVWLDLVTYLHHHGHEDKLPWYRGKGENVILQTRAAKPVLGKYHRDPKKSGPLPFYLVANFVRSLKRDHYITDNGDVVDYQTDPEIRASVKILSDTGNL
ncbi:hypothetical protein ACP275_10G016100 [Erythranthe tilingii]